MQCRYVAYVAVYDIWMVKVSFEKAKEENQQGKKREVTYGHSRHASGYV